MFLINEAVKILRLRHCPYFRDNFSGTDTNITFILFKVTTFLLIYTGTPTLFNKSSFLRLPVSYLLCRTTFTTLIL